MNLTNEAIQYIHELEKSDSCGDAYLKKFSIKEQYNIFMTVKYAIAHYNLKHGENMGGACYSCKHHRQVPGDAHSACANQLSIVIGDEHGIKNGWFLHPFNFDPVWLRYCDGFEPIKPD